MKHSAEWATRVMHEARYYERRSFLTLSYATPHLPARGTLVFKHLQDFWKRIRTYLKRNHNVTDTKYFACGEYGEKKGRPHYHAILLGWDFPDKVPIKQSEKTQEVLYRSEQLQKLWGLGDCFIGEVTSQSAAYTARYTMKKVYGEAAEEEYHAMEKEPPFITMSQGLGRRYFNQFKTDMYPCDYVTTEDYRKIQIPRFYDKLLAQLSADELEHIKEQRKIRAAAGNQNDRTPERLKIREAVLKLKIRSLQRNLERVQNETQNVTQSSKNDTDYPPEGWKMGKIGPK